MAGTILVDPQQKRLAHLNGRLVGNVNFGFGILGRLAKGGTFEIERTQVSSSHWKTQLVDIQVSGRMLLFKTVSKQQRETRSDFELAPKDLDVRQAEDLLQSRPDYQAIAVHPIQLRYDIASCSGGTDPRCTFDEKATWPRVAVWSISVSANAWAIA